MMDTPKRNINIHEAFQNPCLQRRAVKKIQVIDTVEKMYRLV